MKILLTFGIVFLVVYLFYLVFVISRKKVIKIKNGNEAMFLKRKYKLKLDKISDKGLANIIAITNAFIMAITFIVLEFVENYVLKIMIAFVLLIVLILTMYTIIGKILKKKEGK